MSEQAKQLHDAVDFPLREMDRSATTGQIVDEVQSAFCKVEYDLFVVQMLWCAKTICSLSNVYTKGGGNLCFIYHPRREGKEAKKNFPSSKGENEK